jgi:hypothetical protein
MANRQAASKARFGFSCCSSWTAAAIRQLLAKLAASASLINGLSIIGSGSYQLVCQESSGSGPSKADRCGTESDRRGAPGRVGTGCGFSSVAVSVVEQMLVLDRAGQPAVTELRQIHVEHVTPCPMPDMALRLDPLWQELDRREESCRKPTLLVDVAGTGMMLARLMAKRAPIGVVVANGSAERVADGLYHVPRRELAGRLLLAVQEGRFRTARTLPAAQRFAEALQNFKLQPSSTTGDDVLAVMRAAADDDLVLAAGMCAWWAARDLPGPYVKRPKANGWDYDPLKAAGF